MNLTQRYKIENTPVVAPNAGVQLRVSDIEAEESGRDESGYLHRVVLRPGLATWTLSYRDLSREEYDYMMALLPGSGSFLFTHPDNADADRSNVSRCCITDIRAGWHNALPGQSRELKITVTQC